jgi:hypothetical protein
VDEGRQERLYPEVVDRLRPLAWPLPQAGDWLAEHREEGQSFAEYLAADPARHEAGHLAQALPLPDVLSP